MYIDDALGLVTYTQCLDHELLKSIIYSLILYIKAAYSVFSESDGIHFTLIFSCWATNLIGMPTICLLFFVPVLEMLWIVSMPLTILFR